MTTQQSKSALFPRAPPNAETPAKALRRVLASPGPQQAPACYDGLSGKLVERAGFPCCIMSGFSVSAARLGMPDAGLISYGEMVDQGREITQAVSIPVIGDGDTGYGNHINVKRTVRGYIQAGFAGIILEDQVSPKACGHTRGRKVVSREEAITRIKAAVDARRESGLDIVIVARTDARQAVSLEEALTRSLAFADAGADVLFIDALASKEEMKAFCEISSSLPKMANMLEGGGKTPILSPAELEDIGFKLICYPISLIGVSMRAMEDALAAIKSGCIPPPGKIPSFEEIKDTVGFNDYYEEEKKYSVTPLQPSYQGGVSNLPSLHSSYTTNQTDTGSLEQKAYEQVIEVITPYVHESSGSDDFTSRKTGIWSRTLRLKITGRDGLEKFDVKLPAGVLEGMSKIIQGLGGVNIMQLLESAPADDASQSEKVLLDTSDASGDRIQVFV